MIETLRDLVLHKNHANAALLSAVSANDCAASDPELRRLLHHIILANRFWLALLTGSDFNVLEEQALPESLRSLENLYRDVNDRELSWVDGLRDADLQRTVATDFFPGRSFTLLQALMQVCLHSHAHRAQCAARLRQLGGSPPPTDFITWLEERPAAQWPAL